MSSYRQTATVADIYFCIKVSARAQPECPPPWGGNPPRYVRILG
jgi:hypothetical protein